MSFFLKITIYYVLCYLYVRLWFWRLLAETPRFRRRLLFTTDIFTLLLPLIIYAGRELPPWFYLSLSAIGYCWAAVIVSLIPLGLVAEPVRLIIKRIRPGFRLCSGKKAFSAVVIIEALLLIGGLVNARTPVIRELKIDLPGKASQRKEMTLVAFSDLHAGNLVNQSWVADIVEKVNALSPDAILLLGDTLGDRQVKQNGTLKELAKLKAPLGVFAVLGNHEYYLDGRWAPELLEDIGINVLEDEVVILDGSLMLAGRKDLTVQRRGGKRLALNELLPENPTLPIVLLDHNPSNLSEAAESKVDFQLSGHTHNGQIFPVNLVMRLLYEKAWGEYRKGKTRYYISCGVGVWGPPLRTSSIPEILLIKIRFIPSGFRTYP